MRREAIRRALEATGGSQVQAAELLGITPSALVAMLPRQMKQVDPKVDALMARVIARQAED